MNINLISVVKDFSATTWEKDSTEISICYNIPGRNGYLLNLA